MDLALQIQEKLVFLDDNKKKLILEIINNFTHYAEDEDDDLTEQDLYYIDLAEQEYANGETINHSDIKWKQ